MSSAGRGSVGEMAMDIPPRGDNQGDVMLAGGWRRTERRLWNRQVNFIAVKFIRLDASIHAPGFIDSEHRRPSKPHRADNGADRAPSDCVAIAVGQFMTARALSRAEEFCLGQHRRFVEINETLGGEFQALAIGTEEARGVGLRGEVPEVGCFKRAQVGHRHVRHFMNVGEGKSEYLTPFS